MTPTTLGRNAAGKWWVECREHLLLVSNLPDATTAELRANAHDLERHADKLPA